MKRGNVLRALQHYVPVSTDEKTSHLTEEGVTLQDAELRFEPESDPKAVCVIALQASRTARADVLVNV